MDAVSRMLDFHGDALRLRAERQRTLASNIANADTSGYQARDFDFAKALKEATGIPGAAPGTLKATDTRHLGATGGASTVSLAYRTPHQASLDGNTVEVDAERARFAENTVRYEATLRFMNGQIQSLLSAMKGQ